MGFDEAILFWVAKQIAETLVAIFVLAVIFGILFLISR
jgi:hypothetical protein